MQKTVIALALAASFAAPVFAADAAPASEHTLTGNVGLFSSYRFRGIDQTFGKPALQGGFDYSHASGFYAGNWNSNVTQYAGFPDGNLEMDFYAGYKKAYGDFGVDVGALYYYYPGTDVAAVGGFANNGHTKASGKVDNTELYVAGSWKFVTLKYSHAVSDYFAVPDTKGTNYWDLAANYDLGDGWGVNAHVGRLKVKHLSDADYTDWKVGVTKDFSGWVVGLAYVDTNAKDSFYTWTNGSGKTHEAAKGTGVLSLSKTF